MPNVLSFVLCFSTSLHKCRSNETYVSAAFSKVIFNLFSLLSVLFLLPLMLNVPKCLKNVRIYCPRFVHCYCYYTLSPKSSQCYEEMLLVLTNLLILILSKCPHVKCNDNLLFMPLLSKLFNFTSKSFEDRQTEGQRFLLSAGLLSS